MILNIHHALCFSSPGSVKKRACPRDSAADCMRCGPEQYVDEASAKPQCHACVSCAGLFPPPQLQSLSPFYLYFIHLDFPAAELPILGY